MLRRGRLATILRMTDSTVIAARGVAAGAHRNEEKIRRYRLVRVKLEADARRVRGPERHAHLRRVYD
jgi:hypothetical protein